MGKYADVDDGGSSSLSMGNMGAENCFGIIDEERRML